MQEYNHKKIEKEWREKWEQNETFKTDTGSDKPKQYILDMFPYPSGEGLHVGHPRGYIATDIYSRMKRMQGFSVLHPMGWDAFGLPAENYAIKNKVHPSVAVKENVARFKQQLSIIGLDYDWSKEIDTTDPAFYKWTQWIFLQMYKKGLAYESNEPINWCPSCQTGLANEDVEADGTCERCGTQVEKKPMRQWVLKITDYADRMLADLDKLPKWPDGVKEAQRHWIGKSEGAEIDFAIKGSDAKITVFTTRADTLFGVTYVVLAPEHELISNLKSQISNFAEVEKYIEEAKNKDDIVRTAEGKEKTGVKLEGIFAINPASGEEVPVWVADYVLPNYGTGAVMAVPAHDERDFAFAKKYGLSMKHVIAPETGIKNENEEIRPSVVVIVQDPKTKKVLKIVWGKEYGDRRLFIGGGIESGENLEAAARREILEETGYKNVVLKNTSGTVFHHYYSAAKNKYRMTEAVGMLFELVDDEQTNPSLDEHEKGKFTFEWVAVDESRFDVADEQHKFMHDYLLDDKIFTGDGILIDSEKFNGIYSDTARQKITESVGCKMVTKYRIKDWVFSRQRYWGEPIPIIHCPKCGVVPVPEKDLPVTLPNVENYAPTGTGESPLADITDWLNVPCPTCGDAAKRETNTMPQWAGSSWYYLRFIDPTNSNALIDADLEKKWMPVDVYVGGDHATRHLIYARFWHKFLFDIGVVTTEEPFPRLEFLGFILASDGRKMSKRWGNIVNPDEMVERFGADSFRLYEMFIGPFEYTALWNTNGLVGTSRFLERVWRLKDRLQEGESTDDSTLHKTIKKIGEDIEGFKFNTAVSAMMICVNEMEKMETVSVGDYKKFLQILAPFAPHMTEELWHQLGETNSIHHSTWPAFDSTKLESDTVTITISVNGKARDQIVVAKELSQGDVESLALASEKVQTHLNGAEPKRVIYVAGKLVNFVV